MVNFTSNRVARLSLVLLCALVLGPGACGKGKGKSAVSAEFKGARDLVVQGRWDDAVRALEAYLSQHPHGKQASRAVFFLAKAKLGQGHPDQARAAWQRTIDDYPASLEANKARYKLALLLMVDGKRSEAQAAFAAIAAHPDGPLAAEAAAMSAYLLDAEAEAKAEADPQ